MIRKLFVIIFIFSLISSSVIAIEADVFVQSTVNRASKLLSENISKEEKIKKLELIAKDTVDINGIGFYTLGAARKSLDESDKIKYLELFYEEIFQKFLICKEKISKLMDIFI